MDRQTASQREPGDGADRPANHIAGQHGYVYVARSRRAGGLSLGIDLAPHGQCSFSCIYCQASHPPSDQALANIELGLLRRELERRIADDTEQSLRDLVLAGGGEPTAATNFPEVLESILDVCSLAGFDRPLRIFTNGRHLGREAVVAALVSWIDRGGEVWVKLDGATDEMLSLINGRQVDAQDHMQTLWRLGQQRPIGIQTMLLEGSVLPEPELVASEVADAIVSGLEGGAQLKAIHLLTLARIPSDPEQAARLRPVASERLEKIAERVRARTGRPVQVYG